MGVCNDNWTKYNNKNNGRHDFQIDLGISLLNYGIGLDWDGDARPDYMHVVEFVPCECNQCYFCIHDHTSGVAHVGSKRAAKILYKCNTRVKTEECLMDLGKGGSYCKTCYRL